MIFTIIGVIASAVTILTGLFLALRWVAKKLAGPSSSKKIEYRLQLKEEFASNLRPPDRYGTRGQAIIRDVERADSYPDTHEKSKHTSPWFKVELKDLYYRGVEVFIAFPRYVVMDEKTRKWRFVASKEGKNTIVAYPVGRIPFDNIKEVDWYGDECYDIPHIYCDFHRRRRDPFEEIVYYGKMPKSSYHFEIEGLQPPYRQTRKVFSVLAFLRKLQSKC